MKNLRFPFSYAPLSEEERRSVLGGGELSDSWNNFVDNLRMDDFFYNHGILSASFTFIPTLLFRLVVATFNFAEGLYKDASSRFGVQNKTLTELQDYVDGVRQRHQQSSN